MKSVRRLAGFLAGIPFLAGCFLLPSGESSRVKDVPEELWQSKRPQAAEEIYRLAVSLGGFVTGEHGIGLTRKKFLSLGLDPAQIQLMRQVKEDFDPRYLLNPGKIFS